MRKSLTLFEYPSNWSITCRRVYKLQPRCTNNPWHGRATVVHHIKYKRSFWRRILGMFLLHFPRASVSGYEIPGWDCVGVCCRCHQNYYGRSSSRTSVHYHQVWVQRGGLDNRQTWIKATSLRIKFCFLALTRSWLNHLWNKDKQYYVGEWHFHPFSNPNPSQIDINEMQKIGDSYSYQCPEPLLLIIGGDPNIQWDIKVYIFPRNRPLVELIKCF